VTLAEHVAVLVKDRSTQASLCCTSEEWSWRGVDATRTMGWSAHGEVHVAVCSFTGHGRVSDVEMLNVYPGICRVREVWI
jgi:hypothetical protein